MGWSAAPSWSAASGSCIEELYAPQSASFVDTPWSENRAEPSRAPGGLGMRRPRSGLLPSCLSTSACPELPPKAWRYSGKTSDTLSRNLEEGREAGGGKTLTNEALCLCTRVWLVCKAAAGCCSYFSPTKGCSAYLGPPPHAEKSHHKEHPVLRCAGRASSSRLRMHVLIDGRGLPCLLVTGRQVWVREQGVEGGTRCCWPSPPRRALRVKPRHVWAKRSVGTWKCESGWDVGPGVPSSSGVHIVKVRRPSLGCRACRPAAAG